jgi:hypothetical protein
LALFTKYKAFFSTFRTPHRNPASLQAISSSSHLPPVPLPARLPRSARTDRWGINQRITANHQAQRDLCLHRFAKFATVSGSFSGGPRAQAFLRPDRPPRMPAVCRRQNSGRRKGFQCPLSIS